MPRLRLKSLWRLSKNLFLILFTLFLLLSMSVGGVEAADGMSGWDECVVQADEYIEHDFYFVCRTLVIHGTIEGDVMGMAFKVTIARDAHVMGDVWVLGGKLVVQGEIDDDVRFGGASVEITDQARMTNPKGDITAAAIEVDIQQDAVVPGDVLMYGVQLSIQGEVGGDIDFQGQIFILEQGRVNGNVDVLVGDARQEVSVRTLPIYDIRLRRNYGLYITRDAYVGGNLNYQSAQQIGIPSHVVQGETSYTQLLEQDDITRVEQPETFISITRSYIARVYRDFTTFMIVGSLLLWLAPNIMTETVNRVRRSVIPAFSWGFITSILTIPVFILVLFFSILIFFAITILTYFSSMLFVVGIFLIILNVIVLAAFAFWVFYLGPTIAYFILGRAIIRIIQRNWARRNRHPDDPPLYFPPLPPHYRWVALALGVLVFALIVNLPLPQPVPVIALMLQAGASWVGLGAFFIYGRDFWYVGGQRVKRRSWVERRLQKGTPPPEEPDIPLGMDNLPEGFDWFTNDD